MTTDRLLKVHSRKPFAPYTIHVADGTVVKVTNPEMMLSTQNMRTIEVLNGTTTEYIDLLLVTKLTTAAE